MPSYHFTNKAVEDISAIWDYGYENWSEHQADKYYTEIISTCEKVAKELVVGRNYKGITNSLFGVKVNRHIIFYRNFGSGKIEVERILHERMDLKNRMSD